MVEKTAHPFDVGAVIEPYRVDSTTALATLWTCMLRASIEGVSVITTAHLETVDSMTVRLSIASPWDPPDCLNVSKPHVASYGKTMLSKVDHTRGKLSMNMFDSNLVTAAVDGYTL